ncbi:FHA domain-containing protein [Roseiconus lacunae]|uniref:FHA domain-containing protein n=1 Tax=Roseiconus lacunae TaxID=2605694 RepID=UPI001E2FA7D2|nr:FHA domain-containing protein [Roseiconus lacunae]MCD0457881.1 hypothetical protein [Roseiconus lacunae]
MPLLLKVFSGTHVGAEVMLDEGVNSIGSGDQCDIVLSDRLIAEKHVEILVTGDDVTCRADNGKFFLVDGQRQTESALRCFQFFTLGTTHMAVGPADKTWPEFDLSDFQLREPDRNVDSDDECENDSQNEPGNSNTQVDEQADQAAHVGSKPRRFGRSTLLASAIGSVLLVISGTTLFSRAESPSIDRQAAHSDQAMRKLNRLLQQESIDAEITYLGDRLQLQGYCQTEQQREMLGSLAHSVDNNVIVKIRSTEALIEKTREQIPGPEFSGVKLIAMSPGEIKATGRVDESKDLRNQWALLVKNLEKNIPLKRFQSEIEFASAPMANVTTTSKSRRSLLPKLSSGNLSDQGPAELIIANALAVRDVRIAHDRVVTLHDGRQVTEGAQLPDGSLVEQVTLDHIITKLRTGQRQYIPFGL